MILAALDRHIIIVAYLGVPLFGVMRHNRLTANQNHVTHRKHTGTHEDMKT